MSSLYHPLLLIADRTKNCHSATYQHGAARATSVISR